MMTILLLVGDGWKKVKEKCVKMKKALESKGLKVDINKIKSMKLNFAFCFQRVAYKTSLRQGLHACAPHQENFICYYACNDNKRITLNNYENVDSFIKKQKFSLRFHMNTGNIVGYELQLSSRSSKKVIFMPAHKSFLPTPLLSNN